METNTDRDMKMIGRELTVYGDNRGSNSALSEGLSGKITISRVTSNTRDEDYMSIEIMYDGKRVKVEMEMKDYGYAVSGLSMQPVKVRAT